MLAYQSPLPLPRPPQTHLRCVRRPFHPSRDTGPYRLPRDIQDRLITDLAPFRNRDDAFALAVFIARFWSVPGRIGLGFPIDRRELAGHPELGLTEARVRGAIWVLEEIGFLDRAIPLPGSRYKRTEEGLRRKPVLFVFGAEYAPVFLAANRRAAAARGARSGERRTMTPSNVSRLSGASPGARPTKSPINKERSESQVIMGDLTKRNGIPPKASEPNPRLEAALERLRQEVFGKAGGV